MTPIKAFLLKYKAAFYIGIAALIIAAIGLAYCKGEGAGKAKEQVKSAEASVEATLGQMADERAASDAKDKRDDALDAKFDKVEKNIETEYRNRRSPLDAAFDGLPHDDKGGADKPAP